MKQKVYLIVEDYPYTKVIARVFSTEEKAKKALNERDEMTGERRYVGFHIVEREIE